MKDSWIKNLLIMFLYCGVLGFWVLVNFILGMWLGK